MTTKKIDYLDEDPVIHGQEWICVSFLSPEGVKNCRLRGFKFRGAFATRQEAEAHAKEIQDKLDPDFHIYVGEGFKWLPWDQDPETVENQEYHEKELNELMKSVKENLLLKKRHEIERKNKYLQEAKEINSRSKENGKTKERLQQKLLKKQKELEEQGTEKLENADKQKEPVEIPNDVKEDVLKLEDIDKKIETDKQTVADVNERLKKLESVYYKLCQKKNKKQ